MNSELAAKLQERFRWTNWVRNREAEARGDPGKRWSLIRDIYRQLEPEIIEATKKGYVLNPYWITWVFTPIEQCVWNDIRPRAPLYPQYPVLNHFIDFGNPYFKVGIEADGKDYLDAVEPLK